MSFSDDIKNKLVNAVIQFINENQILPNDDTHLDFLSEFWDLDRLPSEDSRFSSAREDIWQHMINNRDWEANYLLKTRFKLKQLDDKKLILFIQQLPRFIMPELIESYSSNIKACLQNSDFELQYYMKDNEIKLSIFQISNYELRPSGISRNLIPFFLEKADAVIDEYPCFLLKYDNWDDYTNKTMFDISYCPVKWEKIYLCKIKIMKIGINKTWDILENKFVELSNEFCSLGQHIEYYKKLEKIVEQEQFYNILYALKDAAFFPGIQEKFSSDDIFNTSLIRMNNVERLLRTARIQISNDDLANYYKLKYRFKPNYADEERIINFNFVTSEEHSNRVFALIGKNGVGKTQLLSKLASSIAQNNISNFCNKKPSFAKIFTISYSVFDRFELPKTNAEFNYIYCGFKKTNTELFSQREIDEKIQQTIIKLSTRIDLKEKWYSILQGFIDQSLLNLIVKNHGTDQNEKLTIIEDNWQLFFRQLSSGQSILLNLVTRLLAEIRYDSLILFDEPETHLHPNAISELISTIFYIVNLFESFCIISTHSPIVIQQFRANNVIVLEKAGSKCIVSKLEQDSLGENLTAITDNIFGNRNIPQYFTNHIQHLVKQGYDYNKICTLLSTEEVPLALNTMLYIKTLIKQHHEKS